MAASVLQTLMHATSVVKQPQEDEQIFLNRLVSTASKMPDEDWAKLSTKAKKWLNGAIDDVQDKKPIRECEGIEEIRMAKKPVVAKGKAKEAVEEVVFAEGDLIAATSLKTKKVKEGTFLEDDGSMVFLEVDGEEQGFKHDKFEFTLIKKASSKATAAADDEEDDDGAEEVNTNFSKHVVVIKKATGEEVCSGTLIEEDDNTFTVEGDDGEDSYKKSRYTFEYVQVEEAGAEEGSAETEVDVISIKTGAVEETGILIEEDDKTFTVLVTDDEGEEDELTYKKARFSYSPVGKAEHPAEEQEPSEDDGEEEDEEEVPAKRPAKKEVPAKKAEVKEDDEEKGKPGRPASKGGAELMKYLANNLEATLEETVEYLQDKKVDLAQATIRMTFDRFKQTVEALRAAKKMK